MSKAGGSRVKGWMLILMVSILISSLEPLFVAAGDEQSAPTPAPESGAPPPPSPPSPPPPPSTSSNSSTPPSTPPGVAPTDPGNSIKSGGGGGSSKMSGGAKAGIAFAVIFGVVAIGGGYYIFRKRANYVPYPRPADL